MKKATSQTKPPKNNRNGWTAERRSRQSQAIRRWQPWQQSTGAKTPEVKAKSARNAFKGGFVAQLRVLRKEMHAILREHKAMIDKTTF